jgi:hypothetical protein
VLTGTKLIAEACDTARFRRIEGFVGDAWEERNCRFRVHGMPDACREMYRFAPLVERGIQ